MHPLEGRQYTKIGVLQTTRQGGIEWRKIVE
jgi:hypothetical protein